MTVRFDFYSPSLGWLLVLLFVGVLIAFPGYFIATRRVKQPFVVFLLRFALVFFTLFVVETLVLEFIPSFHTTMRNLTATLVGGVLSLVGANHSVNGSTVVLQNPDLAFDVTAACLGGMLLWTYVALVVAESSASRNQRIMGIIIGVVIILLFNFVRIILSIYLERGTGVRVHDYFYLVNMVFVLAVWLGWLRTVKPQKPKLLRLAH